MFFKFFLKISTPAFFPSKPFKNQKNKLLLLILFLFFQHLYSPLLFSNPYRNEEPIEKPNWTCEIDNECLRYLQSDLDKENDYSIYKVCQYEYDAVKNCCESLNNCPSRYGVEQNLENIKSNLLNSPVNQATCSAGNLSSLIGSIHNKQKEVCRLGAENCKAGCENKLEEFKRRVKSCFSIDSSIDQALKQVETAQNNISCYNQLKEIAEKYKRQSLNKKSELREKLSVQDIVDCNAVKNKTNRAIGAKKAIEICNQVNQKVLERQKTEQSKKEEEERVAREQKKQAEMERQKAKELRRKQENLESREAFYQADMGYTEDKNTESPNLKSNLQESDKLTDISPKSESQQSSHREVAGLNIEQANKEDTKPKSEGAQNQEKADKKAEKADGKDKKQILNSKTVKIEKLNKNTQINHAVSAGSVQGASIQTQTKTPESLSKRSASKPRANNNRNSTAGSNKTETLNIKPSQEKIPTQAQPSGIAPSSSLAGNTTNKCSIKMPQIIKPVTAFQNKQTAQQGKPSNDPAVIMVEIGGLEHFTNNTELMQKQFQLSINIKNKIKLLDCFLETTERNLITGQKSSCYFSYLDWRKNLKSTKDKHFKFFPFLIKKDFLNDKGHLEATAILDTTDSKNNRKCRAETNLKIKILKTDYDFKLGFTRIDDRNKCFATNANMKEKPVSSNTITKFANSFKVNPDFPIMKITPQILKHSLNRKEENCNNSLIDTKLKATDLLEGVHINKHAQLTSDLLKDISDLEYMRADLGYNQLSAIAPKSYFSFHKQPKILGFTIHPKEKTKRALDLESWNIAFVQEDAVELLEHTNNKQNIKNLLTDEETLQRAFFQKTLKFLPKKTLTQNVNPNEFLYYEQEENSSLKAVVSGFYYPKMDLPIPYLRVLKIARKVLKNNDITTAKKILSNKANSPKNEKETKALYKNILSIAEKLETEQLIKDILFPESFAVVPGGVELRQTKLITPPIQSGKWPRITFLLKDGKNKLHTIKRPLFERQIKILYKEKEGSAQIETFDLFPFIAVFDLPNNYEKIDDLHIVILSPIGKKEIYSAPVPKNTKRAKQASPITVKSFSPSQKEIFSQLSSQ